ncbi:FMN-binding protein [Patulibacter sp. NPDC049589]|uniref:FMN-binding protein n=1 Tax=Patulibacter sp. NPDC049589 TaxID=3154731 RepID=UPI003434D8FF
MRRAPIVISSTIVGVVAVLTFHTRQPTVATALTAGTTTTGAATPETSAGTAAGAASGSATGTTSSGSTTASSTSGTHSATGSAIDTQYGAAQVKVTVSDGKITDVQALQLQGNEPKSVQISGAAAPLLRESALEKQSAALDAVSGATITSASYEASLQSALDKLGFKAADGSRGTSTIPQVEEHHDGPDGGPGGGDPSDELFQDQGAG